MTSNLLQFLTLANDTKKTPKSVSTSNFFWLQLSSVFDRLYNRGWFGCHGFSVQHHLWHGECLHSLALPFPPPRNLCRCGTVNPLTQRKWGNQSQRNWRWYYVTSLPQTPCSAFTQNQATKLVKLFALIISAQFPGERKRERRREGGWVEGGTHRKADKIKRERRESDGKRVFIVNLRPVCPLALIL